MKKAAYVIGLFFLLSSTVFAQSICKSLAFAQIASGGAWETVINVTNRGTTTYTGFLSLHTMGADGITPMPWNPIVNGTKVTNSQMAILIPAGSMQTLTITAENLETGFGTITPSAPSDSNQTSFVEGSLTYFYLSGNEVLDSIGVEPSNQIYLTTIPFDKFASIAFALANTNANTASVNLTVYSASTPVQVLGTTTLSLARNAHVAEYLYQVFPSIAEEVPGRLDIECDIPIYGLALTQVGSQFSSLPFLPAVKGYTWTENFTPTGTVKTGTLGARLGGALLQYQKTTLTPVQEASRYLGGTYSDGALSMVDFDFAAGQVRYWTFNSFSFSMSMVTGTVKLYSLTPAYSYLGQGSITLVAAGASSPADARVTQRALAQTGLAMGQASTVMQSQAQMVFAKLSKSTSCEALPGGGSVLVNASTTSVYYDSNCTKPYVVASPAMNGENGVLSISENAAYYGLDGTSLGTMAISETADFSDSSTTALYGLATFTPASGTQKPAQLGMYCRLSSTGVGQCAGGIVQDFTDLGIAIGAVTPLTLHYDPESSASPMTFTGSGITVTGPIGALTLTNPSPTSLVIQGGTTYAVTAAEGGAAAFALFPPTPTGWMLTDSAHDSQFQITVVDNETRTLTLKITQISTGATLATGTIDRSGGGTITWADNSISTVINWLLEEK
jgi:hypothetical protein